MRVLAISGSLRRDSHNTKLLREAEELLPAGVAFDLYDELELVPPYNEDRDRDEERWRGNRRESAVAQRERRHRRDATTVYKALTAR